MKKQIKIDGMSCGHCVAHVKEALEELQGVDIVAVSRENKEAIIEGDVEDEAIKEALDDAGYDVIGIYEV